MFRSNSLIIFVTSSFFLYAVGCSGSNEAMKHLQKYDNMPYADLMTLVASKEAAHKAAVLALQHKGYEVTVSDPETGLISGELNSPGSLPEEEAAQPKNESGGVGSVLIAILGIVLVFGLIATLDGCSKSSGSQSQTTETQSYSELQPQVTTSFKYVASLNTSSLDRGKVQFQVTVTRIVLENGGVSSSGRIENKYINYGLFDAIQDELDNLERPKEK